MNFLRRSLTGIVRQPFKSGLLLVLVFLLGTVTAGAISIHMAIHNTDRALRHQTPNLMAIGEESTLMWDYFINDLDSPERLNRGRVSVELVQEVGQLPYVRAFDYSAFGSLSSFELRNYIGESLSAFLREEAEDWPIGNFWINGTSNENPVQFELGIMNLVEGRTFVEDELVSGDEPVAVLIPERLAQLNHLSVGSSFDLYSFIFMPATPENEIWGVERYEDANIFGKIAREFVVIGIYEIPLSFDSDGGSLNRAQQDAADTGINHMMMPNWAINEMNIRFRDAFVSAWENSPYEMPFMTFALEHPVGNMFMVNPEVMPAFREAVEPLLPNQFYRIVDLSGRFEGISSVMATMQDIADWILYASIGATIVIVVLLVTLAMRDRIKEVGIYLALGERKYKIFLQIWVETLLVSLVGISLALILGHFLSDLLSQNMMMENLAAQVAEQNQRSVYTGGTDSAVIARLNIPSPPMTVEEMQAMFDTSLTLEMVGIFYGVSIGVVFVSTLIPMLFVLAMNPKHILLEDFSREEFSVKKRVRVICYGTCAVVVVLGAVFVFGGFDGDEVLEDVVYEFSDYEDGGLTLAEQHRWNVIEARLEGSYSDWLELVDFAIAEDLTFAARLDGEPLADDLHERVNRYGLVADFSHGAVGFGSRRDALEVVLELHFDAVSYREVVAELLALDRSSGSVLHEWLAQGGQERLASYFGTVEIDAVSGAWEVAYLERLALDGVLRISGVLENVVEEVEVEPVLVYGFRESDWNLNRYWVVGEDFPAGRYVLESVRNNVVVNVLLNGENILAVDGAGSRTTRDLDDGDILEVHGAVELTLVTERTLSETVGRGDWVVGKDLRAGLVDITVPSRTGRIEIRRDGVLIFSEVLGGGSVWEGWNEVQGSPRLRTVLENGDAVSILELPRVYFTPVMMD